MSLRNLNVELRKLRLVLFIVMKQLGDVNIHGESLKFLISSKIEMNFTGKQRCIKKSTTISHTSAVEFLSTEIKLSQVTLKFTFKVILIIAHKNLYFSCTLP